MNINGISNVWQIAWNFFSDTTKFNNQLDNHLIRMTGQTENERYVCSEAY
jgi:hypothetical protein